MGNKKILFAAIGVPFTSDMSTTLFRLLEAALAQGHQVSVWTCGGATSLTAETLGEHRPRNFLNMERRYPSTAALAAALLAQNLDRLEWFICRHCMEERGTIHQIEQVKIQPPFRFLKYYQQADVCLTMGPR